MSKFGNSDANNYFNFNQFQFFTETPKCIVSVAKKEEVLEQEMIECSSPVHRVASPVLTFESIYNKPESEIRYEQKISKDDGNIVLSISETIEIEPEEKVIEEVPKQELKREPSLKLLVQRLMLDKKCKQNGWKSLII